MARILLTLVRTIRNSIQRICGSCFYQPTSTIGSRPKFLRHLDLNNIISHTLCLTNIFILIWFFVLIWGEYWIFQSSVKHCDWKNWETWPDGASPHHLIFLADPQLIDPHSYPSRSWPLDLLTTVHTDKYLKRSYISLQKNLHPDTIIFLGDLFDGGREWKPFRSHVKDTTWSDSQRPSREQIYAKIWAKNYGEDFWLHEYDRFGKIFFKFWGVGGLNPRPWQRGRKIISSLPGNHDLGFGDNIKISVRNRFQAYFGELNRVDIIGNHTFVSVDSLSLSAGDSSHEVAAITKPVEDFLATVKVLKKRAVARELGYMAGKDSLIQYAHKIEDLVSNFTTLSTLDSDPNLSEFPTILLTHVPLYREPGTPCGPLRERWPPTKPPKGQNTIVNPDERNSISISKGYQYQNVLSQSHSIKLVSSVGNVVLVLSGDDHDYCEIIHPADKHNVKEITVKSISWAMGIRRPGFLLLSMWNPVDDSGRNFYESDTNIHDPTSQTPPTTQSSLCLLPDQIGILISYLYLALTTIFALVLRSFLIAILNLRSFASNHHKFDPFVTRKNSNPQMNNNLFRPSFSFSSPSRMINLALRHNMRRSQPDLQSEYGISTDCQRWDPATPSISTNHLAHSFQNQIIDDDKEESGEFFKANLSGNVFQLFYSECRNATTKSSIRNLIIREAIVSIWRVTWIATLLYLCLFYLH